jgi:mannose-6-phosphate isomerase-like protein (cupin superfamily)
MASAQEVENRFQIYRAEDAANLKDTGRMTMEPIAPNILDWAVKAAKAGYPNGEQVKLLVDIPGFSLTHVWFKKNFPLPLHSHDSDCLYYIIAGSLRLGTEDLGPGDSFFVPKDVPYAYRPGEEGVELLEFRTANAFNFVNHAKSEAFWAKAAQTCADNNEDWQSARLPSLRV